MLCLVFSFLVGFLSSFSLPFSGFLFCLFVCFLLSFSSLHPSPISSFLSFPFLFLPIVCSLSGWSVNSPGSPCLGMPLCSVNTFPRFILVLCFSVCLGSAPFLPCSPAPPESCVLVVLLSPRWAPPLRVYWFTHPVLVPLRFCALPVSSIAHPSGVVVLFSSSVFVFVRRLSLSVVFLSAFSMGSPWPGSSVGVVFLHSIGTKASSQ